MPALARERGGPAGSAVGKLRPIVVGYRRIAAELARPPATVRRWVRAVRGAHSEWLRAQAVGWLVIVDRDVISTLAPARFPLGDALNAVAAAALAVHARFALHTPIPDRLFVLAALAEIGRAWLVWQGVREHRGWAWIGAGVIALGIYGFVATLQPDAHFGRILAAYGGVFVAGSLLWGVVLDGFRPDRWDIIGA